MMNKNCFLNLVFVSAFMFNIFVAQVFPDPPPSPPDNPNPPPPPPPYVDTEDMSL